MICEGESTFTGVCVPSFLSLFILLRLFNSRAGIDVDDNRKLS